MKNISPVSFHRKDNDQLIEKLNLAVNNKPNILDILVRACKKAERNESNMINPNLDLLYTLKEAIAKAEGKTE